jgi:hypothetical protein
VRYLSLLLVLSFGLSNGLPITIDPPANVSRESSLLSETNRARAAHGLAPLEPNEGLARAARGHAQEMALLGFFSHNSPTPESATLGHRLARAGVPSTRAAENLSLLRGHAEAEIARAAVAGWLDSPGHRAALLHPEYTHVGFGAFDGAAKGELFVAQVFAREPRRLVGADAERAPRQGFELSVTVELTRATTVVPRLAGVTREPLTLRPGVHEMVLQTESAAVQQLVLATALNEANSYAIQDGGWVTPAAGTWRSDESMPRSGLEIVSVSARPAKGSVIVIELEYEATGAQLAAFVDGTHYPDAQIAPGHLLVYLPAGKTAQVQVGEVFGTSITPFDAFTVVVSPDGPRLQAGSVQ